MSEWLVRLKGHEFDLEELSEHFRSPEHSVSKDEDGYYYLKWLCTKSPSATQLLEAEILKHKYCV